MRLHRPRWPIAVTLLAALTGSTLPVHAQIATPSLRLRAARSSVTLHLRGQRVSLDLGVYAAATGGDFELRVSRSDYDVPVSAAQVDPDSGATLREIPPDGLQGFRGIRRFIRVTFRDAEGQLVARRRLSFCPNSWDRQRLSDEGPVRSVYPEVCGSGFPFAKGMVWGIDEHWASDVLRGGGRFGFRDPKMRVPAGHYSVSVAVTRRYRELFEIAPENGRVDLQVTVKGDEMHRAGPESRADRRGARQPSQSPERGIRTVAAPDPGTLPDLVALPAWHLQVFSQRRGDALAFAASPWNAGPGPLVLEGFRRPDSDVMDAFQYFYDRNGAAVGRASVGTMRYDRKPSHQHWHFLQFAAFRLLDVSNNEVVRSKKQAFCLLPTDAVDLNVPGAEWSPWGFGLSLQSVCGGPNSLWIREALPAGWADTYFQSGLRMGFDITDVPNGWYHVEVAVNPDGVLFEASTANNIERRLIRLGGRPGNRSLLVTPWHGLEA